MIRPSKYIGRGSIWGNPFTHIPTGTKAEFIVPTREDAITNYEDYLLSKPELLKQLPDLNGYDLECYCKPKACHGDILVVYLRAMLRMCEAYELAPSKIDWSDGYRIAQLKSFAVLVRAERK